MLVTVEARNSQETENAWAAFVTHRVQAVMVASDAIFLQQRQRIAELALANRLPTMFPQGDYVEAGGLMSYGENFFDFFRRAASFVDKIFKGAKPGDLPIEQPTKFHLVINRKTADALGVTISPQLYIFADEVSATMSALGAKPDDICSLRAFERSSGAFTRLANRGLSH